MSSVKISSEDLSILEKFCKRFIYKAAQVIVQSRRGEKYSTKCRQTPSSSDWFHLSIKDAAEIEVNTKTVLMDYILFNSKEPFCIEISVCTPSNDEILLEIWSISWNKELCDPSVEIRYTVYNMLGALLRALLTYTRALPAYRFCRNSSDHNHTFRYRMALDSSCCSEIDENFKASVIGKALTPIGSVVLSVMYRTSIHPYAFEETKQRVPALFPHNVNADNKSRRRSPSRNPDKSLPHHSAAFISYNNSNKVKKEIEELPATLLPPSDYKDSNDQSDDDDAKLQANGAIDYNDETAPNTYCWHEKPSGFGVTKDVTQNKDLKEFYRFCTSLPKLECVAETNFVDFMDQLPEAIKKFESKRKEFETLENTLFLMKRESNGLL